MPQEKARVVLVEAGAELFAMFKPDLRAYASEALEKRAVEVVTGDGSRRSRRRGVTLKSGDGACRAHARLGRRAAGQRLVQSLGIELQRGNRIGVGPGPRAPRPPGGLRRRRHRLDHRHEDERGPAAARLGRAPVGRARGREHRAARRRQVDEAVRVLRQGHDGDDRPRRRRRADARREDDEGQKAQLAWGTVHLALLSTNEDRAKAIVDWTGAAHAPARRPDHASTTGRGRPRAREGNP